MSFSDFSGFHSAGTGWNNFTGFSTSNSWAKNPDSSSVSTFSNDFQFSDFQSAVNPSKSHNIAPVHASNVDDSFGSFVSTPSHKPLCPAVSKGLATKTPASADDLLGEEDPYSALRALDAGASFSGMRSIFDTANDGKNTQDNNDDFSDFATGPPSAFAPVVHNSIVSSHQGTNNNNNVPKTTGKSTADIFGQPSSDFTTCNQSKSNQLSNVKSPVSNDLIGLSWTSHQVAAVSASHHDDGGFAEFSSSSTAPCNQQKPPSLLSAHPPDVCSQSPDEKYDCFNSAAGCFNSYRPDQLANQAPSVLSNDLDFMEFSSATVQPKAHNVVEPTASFSHSSSTIHQNVSEASTNGVSPFQTAGLYSQDESSTAKISQRERLPSYDSGDFNIVPPPVESVSDDLHCGAEFEIALNGFSLDDADLFKPSTDVLDRGGYSKTVGKPAVGDDLSLFSHGSAEFPLGLAATSAKVDGEQSSTVDSLHLKEMSVEPASNEATSTENVTKAETGSLQSSGNASVTSWDNPPQLSGVPSTADQLPTFGHCDGAVVPGIPCETSADSTLSNTKTSPVGESVKDSGDNCSANSSAVVSQPAARQDRYSVFNELRSEMPGLDRTSVLSKRRKALHMCSVIFDQTVSCVATTEAPIVAESFLSREGTEFLRDLFEVFVVAGRLLNCAEGDDVEDHYRTLAERFSHLKNLLKDLGLKSAFSETDFSSIMDAIEPSSSKWNSERTCAVCNTAVIRTTQEQQGKEKDSDEAKSKSALKSSICCWPINYGSSTFHSSCANFWITYVDSSLPIDIQ